MAVSGAGTAIRVTISPHQWATVLEVVPDRQFVERRWDTPVADHIQRQFAGAGFGIFSEFSCSPHVRLCALSPDYLALFFAFRRSSGFSSRFRRRRCLGVTSTSSSGPMYSIANSSDISRGGVRTRASSVPAARMLLNCFCLQTFVQVFIAAILAHDHALVHIDGAPINNSPRSWVMKAHRRCWCRLEGHQ